ncbi:nucleotidyltransferase domain-containing protein [filamentous cyanobacterium LEGE 11480]|uniref:Nucleotidyltransferase domain-containing protein n=1 Tax=Romeriopsis navalis LEGE 11480 TaxID=2777977 RepID=A0A928VNC4_9CYAN|nr:nucleotidyltransferase domain-containing protein [Romeriopsis navalis]MBE9029572.1 nucleotidyltransferase domain-containing protein [Romeriopsis navalis LEGE 11480]
MTLNKAMQQRLQQIANDQPYPLIFATVSGAHLYGFPSPDSDYDLRGVHLLPLSEIVGLKTGPETLDISKQLPDLELDLVTHELKKFMGLLLKPNGYVLEQLLSPLVIQTSETHQALKAIAPQCITRHHSHHYLGFVKTQWRLFTKETPPRVKPLLYVYRVLLTGIHLMQTGELEANLVTLNEKFQLAYLPDLIAQKVSVQEKGTLNEADISFHEQEYQRLVSELEQARDRSHLPSKHNAADAMNELLLQVRLG